MVYISQLESLLIFQLHLYLASVTAGASESPWGKGVNLQIIIVAGAQNGNINFRLPSWTVSVYWELYRI